MPNLAEQIASYVQAEVSRQVTAGYASLSVGTVVTSPSQVTSLPLTVIFDGSALAVTVKQVRGLVFTAGARVLLGKFGSDWVVLGGLTNPATGTGTSRIAIGADVPAELKLYGIDTAILVYLNDKATNREVGYFFIGSSNRFDGSGDSRVLAFGNVTYGTLGDPSTVTMSDVKTNMQFDMWGQYRDTLFKDHRVVLWTSMDWETQNGFTRTRMMDGSGFLVAQMDANGIYGGKPSSSNVETWNNLTFANGWTGSFRYMRVASPAKHVVIDCALTPGTKADGTTIGTLPVGYRPTAGKDVVTVAAPQVTTQSPHFNITTGGAINCWGWGSASSGGGSGIMFPLD